MATNPYLKSIFCPLLSITSLSYATTLDNLGETPIQPMRISVSHIEGKGIGYKQGYTTLEGFFAIGVNQLKLMPFLDLRGHVFDDGKFAANAGLGLRTIKGSRIYGANVYYDYRRGYRHGDYSQVSAGLECLSPCWDFRVNGYFPVGTRTNFLYKQSASSVVFNSFSGNNALIQQVNSMHGKFEYAMAGFDAEAAYHLFQNRYLDLYAAVGPYYYSYKDRYAAGGRARVVAEFGPYLRLEAINTYDNRFHEIFQGRISFSAPFGPYVAPAHNQTNCNNYTLNRRLVQNVERQEMIVLSEAHQRKVSGVTTLAIDPATGSPYEFYFVNNTENSGNGTFQNPFPTLAQAQGASAPYDIIYVFPGDGTVTGMDAGIILQDNQQLFGAGIPQTLVTTLGSVVIPRYANMIPVIGNSIGDVITVANNNTISGLYIQNLSGNGIAQINPAVTITDLNVRNNFIQGLLSHNGIDLYNIAGSLSILDNTFGSEFSGIAINNTAISNANFVISNNIFEITPNSPVNITFTNCEGINTLYSGNNGGSNQGAFQVSSTNATTPSLPNNFALIDNKIYNTGPSILSLGANSLTNFAIQNNEFRQAVVSPFLVFLTDTNQTNFLIENNFVQSQNALMSFFSTNSPSNVTLTNNIIYIQTDVTLSASYSGTSVGTLQFAGNQIPIANGNGLMITTSDTSQLTSSITNNSFSNINGNGMSLTASDASINIANISNNTFLANSAGAATIASSSSETTCLTFNANQATPIQATPGVATYQFSNTGSGPFYLEERANIGQISATGTTTGPCP